MHGLAAVDAHRDGLAVLEDMQLAAVARRASDIEDIFAVLRIIVPREADRKLIRILRRARIVYQEPERAHVGGLGKALVLAGVLEMHQPLVAEPLERGALGSVVEALPQFGRCRPAPALVQIVDRVFWRMRGDLSAWVQDGDVDISGASHRRAGASL